MSALSRLQTAAREYGATHLGNDGADAIYAVRPPLPSGAPSQPYLVRMGDRSGSVVVRELEPRRLPKFCPERHISHGGAFCLHWSEAEPLFIHGEEAAALWWGKLVVFLLRQGVAERQRRWPGKADARAHGHEAARYQVLAEIAADQLGEAFGAALRRERLTTARRRRFGEGRIRLFLDQTRVATVLERHRRAMTLRAGCPCSPGRLLTLSSCGNHATAIVDLTLAIDGRERAERDFFDQARACGSVCCGSIDGCPLSVNRSSERAEAA